MSSDNRQRETRVQTPSSPGASSNVRNQTILQQLRGSGEIVDLARLGHSFQPSSSRLRQAAAQALARTHSNRSFTRIMSSISGPPPPRSSNGTSGTVNPSIHPQFRSKAVCSMFCNHCSANLCERGMRAILLGNTSVELFSTDRTPYGVALVDKDYFTKNCHCRIRDAACLGCGNVVGYHVTHPCDRCLEACNNGHFWMFLADAVRPVDRLEKSGSKILRWSSIAESNEIGEDPLVAEQELVGAICR